MDQELLAIMRGVYSRWTGQELAEVIALIRSEFERQRQIKELTELGLTVEQAIAKLQEESEPKPKNKRKSKATINTDEEL